MFLLQKRIINELEIFSKIKIRVPAVKQIFKNTFIFWIIKNNILF